MDGVPTEGMGMESDGVGESKMELGLASSPQAPVAGVAHLPTRRAKAPLRRALAPHGTAAPETAPRHHWVCLPATRADSAVRAAVDSG